MTSMNIQTSNDSIVEAIRAMPLLNEKEKDEDFIAQIEKAQQRSNLTPLQPENNQEQKQDEQEQQSDEEKTRKFKPYRQ